MSYNGMCQNLEDLITQYINIFQMTKAWYYNIMNKEKLHSKCSYKVKKYGKFINMILDSNLQLSFRKPHVEFCYTSKEEYYLQRPLLHFFLF